MMICKIYSLKAMHSSVLLPSSWQGSHGYLLAEQPMGLLLSVRIAPFSAQDIIMQLGSHISPTYKAHAQTHQIGQNHLKKKIILQMQNSKENCSQRL